MAVIHITNANFEEEVIRSDKPVLLDFFAEWCGPCKMIAPSIEEIAEENEHIKVCKIDVDQNMELATRFQIYSIPTLIVMDKGEIVNQALGARSKQQILDLIP
jgi:thioredoxin 1